MPKASSLQVRRGHLLFFLTAALVLVADQLTKLWIRSSLMVGETLWSWGIFDIYRTENTGSSFGLFRGHLLPLTIVAIVGIALILVYTLILHPRLFPPNRQLGKVALGLILGGTIGNLIDRICSLAAPSHFGGVTDFLGLGWWPAFNVADSAIVIGAILFAYCLLVLIFEKR